MSYLSPRDAADAVRRDLAEYWLEIYNEDGARRQTERQVPPGALLLTAEQAKQALEVLRFPAPYTWTERQLEQHDEVVAWLEVRR